MPQGQTCLLSFASSVSRNLVLATSLSIDRNVSIEAPDQQNQVTITPQTPQVAITIGAGYTVWFQNLSFTGLGVTKSAQPDAFIQMTSANVTFVNCNLSNFYSDADGSALSNKYGHLTLEDTTLENNTSTDNGGAISNLGLTSAG